MIDFTDAPFVIVTHDRAGGYHATMHDGTSVRFEPPHTLIVTLPTAEQTAKWAATLESIRLSEEKRARPAKAVQMKRDNPAMSYVEIARAVTASPSSVAKWIKAAA